MRPHDSKPKALVVTNDDSIVPTIDDTLASLDHHYDRATNQTEGRHLVKANEYAYALLDLEIPARSNSKTADRVFGYHLLEDIQYIKGKGHVQTVVIDGQAACLNYVVRYMQRGASDFLSKPFNRRTLAKVIRRIIVAGNCDGFIWQRSGAGAHHSPVFQFSGGDLVFVRDSRGNEWVELCGVRIMSDKGTGQSIRILKELARPERSGGYVRLAAEDLAEAIGAIGGVGTITSCVQLIRRNVFRRLRRHLNCECRDGDVIAHDSQGYYLREWITVHFDDRGAGERDSLYVPGRVPGHVPDDVPGVPKHVPGVPGGGTLNGRQAWVIEQLQQGAQLQRAAVEEQFGVHEKTAKRDLADLRRRGKIEFVGIGRSGHYRLRST